MKCFASSIVVVIYVVVIYLVGGSKLAGEDWLQFRGPDGKGISAEKGLPLKWNEKKNVIWRTPLPGYGASSPITVGDRIFLTGYSGYGVTTEEGGESAEKSTLRLHVICLDRRTGQILWDRSTEANPDVKNYQGFVALHGYASGTPVSDGQAIYAFFGSSGVIAYDLDGIRLWNTSVGTGTHQFGTGASPVLYDDMVIVNASVESGSLVALDKVTSEEVWRSVDVREAWNTPTLVELPGRKPEMVVHTNGRVLAFDPDNGVQLWSFQTGVQHYICASVAAHDGIVYAICGRGEKVVAIRCGGRGDVTETHEVWSSKGRSNVPSPLVHEGHLYWVSDNGIAYCVDAKTGHVVYKKRLRQPDRVYASVTLADDKLYVVSREKGTFVLEARPEFSQLALNVIDNDESIFNASPVVSNGQLLLRSDRFLYCIGKRR